MAHPATEAASSPVPQSIEEKAAAFEDYIFDDDDAPEEEAAPDEGDGDYDFSDEEGGEPDADEETVDEESDEQDEPAIEAPVSLNAEEKEVFSQLPPEAQRAWAASETRRNTQVQEATTRASEAQRVAEAKAAQAEREAELRFGEQLREFTANFAPQEPDPARYSDMQHYQRDKAIYEHQKAQHDALMQQVSVIGVETPEQKAERIRQRDAELMQIPEIANEETRNEFIGKAFAVAEELGYDKSDLAEHMDAGDLRALAQAAKWKADSEELARIKSKAKSRRRDKRTGQFTSLKPGAAPQPSSRAAKASKAFERVKASKSDKEKFGQASAEWLESAGIL